jgi:CRISPR-associated protein Cmr2
MAVEFAAAIAECLAYPREPSESQVDLVSEILRDRGDEPPPSRPDLIAFQERIDRIFPDNDRVALVYGGATKIKGYVFESPKLPEIRGASALLDWVNQRALPEIWSARLGEDLGKRCVIVAAGGTFLAFAPAVQGAALAAAVEACYARHTLTANSVAVAGYFSLLELAYGRDPLAYWIKEFKEDWNREDLYGFLSSYYYLPPPDFYPNLPEIERRFLNRKRFGELVTLLASATTRRREAGGDERLEENSRRRDIVHTPLTPWALRCQSSGVRPAVVDATSGSETRALSEASALKLFVGQRMKQTDDDRDWFERKFGYKPQVVIELETWQKLRPDDEKYTFVVNGAERGAAATSWCAWEDQFRLYLDRSDPNGTYAQKLRQVGQVRPAQDIGELAQASKPARYIGFIYGDGNNAGRKLASLRTPDEYKAFSRKMDDDMRAATFTALARHLEPSNVLDERGRPRTVHPFEIITVGGDDVLLIVPGSAALEIALTLGYEFERLQGDPTQTRDPFGRYRHLSHPNDYNFWNYMPTLGLSAGVVIAPENTPIFFLRNLAEELLKSAKKRVRGHPELGGAIDFMVLKSVTMVTDTIAQFRSQAFGGEGPWVPRATARPYLWPELQGLLATTKKLQAANVPRSQLHRLRERLLEARHERGVMPSIVDYLHTCVSGLRAEARNTLLAEMWKWGEQKPGSNLAPWLHRPVKIAQRNTIELTLDGYETVLPDLVEIAEFIAEERRDA